MPRNKGVQTAAGANKTLETSPTSAGMAMARMSDEAVDATDYIAVFVDTNLDTHLVIPVSFADTAADLKRKIRAEHSKCFLEFGEIGIHDLKVTRRGAQYSLSDLLPVRLVFAWTKKKWFIFANISSQFDHLEAADHNTKPFADQHIRLLPPASPLQGGHQKDERNLQTDNLSGEARSETLQLVTDFNNDDNAKSSSSDTFKRLNAVVENICNFSFDKEKVTGLLSGRKGSNSIGLLTEATSVNQKSLEKNKRNKKRKIAASVHLLNGNDAVEIGSVDKDSASQKFEIMMSLDQNVDDYKHCDHFDTRVGSAGENKREDKSSGINHCKSVPPDCKNRSTAEIEHSLAPHGEEDKILESHDRDTQDVPIERDMAKGTTKKKKKKKMAKAEMMNGEIFSNNDPLDNVSTKSDALAEGNDTSGAYWSTHIIPDSGTKGKHNLLLPDEGKNMNMDVQCNSNNVGCPMDLAEDGTTELVGHKSVPDVRGTEKVATTFEVALDSGMRRSKKRKKGGDDVPLQVDTKGSGELGLPDIEEKERQAEVLAEFPDLGMTRPLKRKKTGFDLPDVIKTDGVCDENPGRPNSMQQSQTKKSKKKTKQKQTPVMKDFAESMGHQRDAMDTEKSKSTRSKSGDEKDDNIQCLSSACEQTNIVAPVVTSEADIETTTKISLDEVVITNHEIVVKPQQGADANIINDADPMQLTQVQKSEDGAEIKNKRSSKKTKQKHKFVVNNMSEFPVEEQKNNLKIDRSNSACTESAAEKNDEMELSSSFQEKIDKAASVADTNADIERRNANGFGVDDNIILTNHGSGVIPPKEADAAMKYDAEPMQLTHVRKSEKKNGSNSEKTKKKIKQKQSHPLKSISEFSVEDQNYNTKLDRSNSACTESAAEKNDEMELSSSFQEKIDKASVADALLLLNIERRNANGFGVDDKIILTNHGSGVIPEKEADATMKYDEEPMQLTHIKESEKKNGSKSEKPKKKIKRKQSHPLKFISEFSVEDQNNNKKLERSKSTLLRSEAEKDDGGPSSSPVEQIDDGGPLSSPVEQISAPQADAEVSNNAQVDEVMITNHGIDVSLQQEADDTCQDDVEPVQLTQAQRSTLDTKNKGVQTKKQTKQQTNAGKNVPKVVEGEQEEARHGISLEKDLKIAPVEVSLNSAKNKGSEENKGVQTKKQTKQQTNAGKNVPKVVEGEQEEARHGISLEKDLKIAPVEVSLNSAKNKGSEETSSGFKHLKKSSLVGQSDNADKQDRSISSAEQYAVADPLKSKVESSALKTKDSGILNKRSHQVKATKELPKMKQHQSNLHKSSNKSTQKVVCNPSKKKSVVSKSKSSSIFKDESSASSAETKGGGDASGSSTETPYDDHVSSSDDESKGSWASPKHGNSKNGGVALHSKPMEENFTMESILRSSHKYKKAKLVASQLQLEDDESQPVDVVPDSQVNT